MPIFRIRTQARPASHMLRHLIFSTMMAVSGLLCAQIDPQATCETRTLYAQLRAVQGHALLFGHQLSNYEGNGWADPDGTADRSDCLAAAGDFPAVFGYDFLYGYEAFREHALRAYRMGAIVTFCDHLDNPSNGEDAWNTQGNPVRRILEPGSPERARFRTHLERVARFFTTLTEGGVPVPVIYRPFHEHTGSWFWWGKAHCTEDEFIALWRYTVRLLRDTLGVHSLLYAYSPASPVHYGGYPERYPGDEFVDILGFDQYGRGNFSHSLLANCRITAALAQAKGKAAAITEFGVSGGIQRTQLDSWFMEALLEPLCRDTLACKVAYAHTWRNGGPDHHWIPMPGSPAHPGFEAFHAHPFTRFAGDLPADLYACGVQPAVRPLGPFARVYPNPAQDQVQVELMHPAEAGLRLRVLDTQGRRVADAPLELPLHTLPLAHWPAGLYLVQIADAGGGLRHQSKFFVE
ncbi:MAG: glycosyl hydrolase [Bacteroidia bacterium]|nr:glycosyl hydrolase [Bacteroidia bacterium]